MFKVVHFIRAPHSISNNISFRRKTFSQFTNCENVSSLRKKLLKDLSKTKNVDSPLTIQDTLAIKYQSICQMKKENTIYIGVNRNHIGALLVNYKDRTETILLLYGLTAKIN